MVDRLAVLVGEDNPYSADPRAALLPLPVNSAGARLQRILGLSRAEYVRAYDRVNLCSTRWVWADAGVHARRLITLSGLPLVLLGSKVCSAFGVDYRPFTCAPRWGRAVVVLPHPSGRCRAWNDPEAPSRARALLREIGALPT